MDLVSPNWTLVMTAITVTSYFVIALVGLWAARAFTTAGLSRLGLKKRLALALGFPVAEAVSPSVAATAIRRIRLRMACLLLTVVGYLVGYQCLARKPDEATA